MAQVKPGDRVTVHGLAGRPELNGSSGILVGPAANGRVTVRLDSGSEVALKPANLGVAAGGGGMPDGGAGSMPGFGGGMPGFGGGMPGFGGGMPGMPGGMPDVSAMAAQLAARFEQQLRAMGIALPPGVTGTHAVAGVAIGALVGLYLASRLVPKSVLILVGAAAYFGHCSPQCRGVISNLAVRASALMGRPVSPNQVLVALCIAVALGGKVMLGGGSGGAAAAVSATSGAAAELGSSTSLMLQEAYQQGFDDAMAGKEARPPKYIPADYPPPRDSTSQGSSSGGFGFGSIMKYGMALMSLYKMGNDGTGRFNIQILIANLKANPQQALMLVLAMYMF